VGAVGGRNFGLPTDLAHRLYNCLLLPHKPWYIYIQGGPKKTHKVNDTIILQPYVVESCGFQQNVPKEISYVTEVNIW